MREVLVLADDRLAHGEEVGKVAGNRIGLAAHVRKNGAERNRGTHGLQRVLRLHQKRWRRLVAGALKRSQDFHDGTAAFVERFAQRGLLRVERFEPPACRVDARLHIAHARGAIDQLLVERAAILADRLDLAPKLGLIFGRHPLVGADRIELLIALFDGFGIGLPRSRKRGRGLRRRRRARCLAGGGWLCAGGDLRGRILRQGAGAGQYQRQYRAEHEARIGATRAAGNHAVQG
ncbi:MAG TPA: hypothetical protein VID96_06475 [Xanthobacteraceae bacterium]